MTTDKQFDESITKWFEETAPARLPERVFDATFERTRRSRQHVGWRAILARLGITRSILALGGTALVVMVAVVGLDFHADRTAIVGPSATATPQPATPDRWSRVLLESYPSGAVTSVAASPRGLLAVVLGEATRLAVSADGRSWTLVPIDQQPLLARDASVVGMDDGFLLLDGDEVWRSEDGLGWQRLASSAADPDLLRSTILAAAVGGPGLVAVGSDNKAWYTTDGSDWTLAEVPPPPAADFEQQGYPAPRVDLEGVAVAGDRLVAWGWASATKAAEELPMQAPVLWVSGDGRSWSSALDPKMGPLAAVAGGPDGFVATGLVSGKVWFSSDGQAWEASDVFRSRWSRNGDGSPVTDEGVAVDPPMVEAAAATRAGYVVVGNDGQCHEAAPCPSREVVIWSSADGRSWSRLPGSDLARGGWTGFAVVESGSRLVIGGVHDDGPAIWTYDLPPDGGGPTAIPPAAEATAPPVAIREPSPAGPSDRPTAALAGGWQATDPPPDSSHLTMEVVAQPDGTYRVKIRDDDASVCGGVSSTMTGVAEVRERGTLVIEQPDYVCDDGSQAQTLSGPPLEEVLRNLTIFNDIGRDGLRDSLGLVWTRAEVTR